MSVRGAARGAETVSVVIPCFNAGHTLAAALASIERQSHAALEVLVVDDGSSPEHVALMKEIAGHFPAARCIQLAQNGGPAGARNRCTQEARGVFVAFLDADDTWLPHKLERCVDLMVERDLDFLGHNTVVAGQRHLTVNDKLRPGTSL